MPTETVALLPDILDEDDVKKFVDSFYDKVVKDDLLRPIFVDIAAVDWDKHLPTMYSFWSSMLLGTRTYAGAPFPVHGELQSHITRAHFVRWLELFEQTIDSLFSGEVADKAKLRAKNVAWAFQSKMGLLPFRVTN